MTTTHSIAENYAKKALFSVADAAFNSGMAAVYCRGAYVKEVGHTYGYVTLKDGLHEIVGVSADTSGIAIHVSPVAIREDAMDTRAL